MKPMPGADGDRGGEDEAARLQADDLRRRRCRTASSASASVSAVNAAGSASSGVMSLNITPGSG